MSTSKEIDGIIKQYGGWKGKTLAQLRSVITSADPDIVEETKWKMKTRPEGLPVWSKNGIICFAETWNDNIKLLFPQGADLEDPKKLFNARLKSKDIRAIEIHEGDEINDTGIRDLVVKAVYSRTA